MVVRILCADIARCGELAETVATAVFVRGRMPSADEIAALLKTAAEG